MAHSSLSGRDMNRNKEHQMLLGQRGGKIWTWALAFSETCFQLCSQGGAIPSLDLCALYVPSQVMSMVLFTLLKVRLIAEDEIPGSLAIPCFCERTTTLLLVRYSKHPASDMISNQDISCSNRNSAGERTTVGHRNLQTVQTLLAGASFTGLIFSSRRLKTEQKYSAVWSV